MNNLPILHVRLREATQAAALRSAAAWIETNRFITLAMTLDGPRPHEDDWTLHLYGQQIPDPPAAPDMESPVAPTPQAAPVMAEER